MAHENIISIITKLIDQDNLPHLLLYGPPGTSLPSYPITEYRTHKAFTITTIQELERRVRLLQPLGGCTGPRLIPPWLWS